MNVQQTSFARLVVLAVGLALGAAVSLGVTRFAYGLLLPPMRADLQWSYTLAGAMNTANALGYLVGALGTPWLLRAFREFGLPRPLLVQQQCQPDPRFSTGGCIKLWLYWHAVLWCVALCKHTHGHGLCAA